MDSRPQKDDGPLMENGSQTPGQVTPAINTERLLSYFFDLLAIDSPYGFEAPAAAYVRTVLTQLNVSFYEDDSASQTGCNTGNIIVCGAQDARISLIAHLDTIRIEHRQPIQIAQGVISAQGGGVLGIDDKSGVAILLEVISFLAEHGGVPADIHFVFTTSEEDGFRGAKHLHPRHFEHAMNFVVDSGGLPIGLVVTEGVWQYGVHGGIHGPMTHTGSRDKQRNAITMLAEWLHSIPTGWLSGQTLFNVSDIQCQGNPNTVPGTCLFSAQLLSFEPDEAHQVLTALSRAMEIFASQKGIQADLTYELDCPGFCVSPDSRLVQWAREAAAAAGVVYRDGRTGAGSDAHVLIQRGAEAIKISTGMCQVHSAAEQIAVSDLVSAARFSLALTNPRRTAWNN